MNNNATQQHIIQQARINWTLGDADITLLAARENRVYLVATGERRAVLRLHRRGYRSHRQIYSELQWMDQLADHGIQLPRPIAGRDGELVYSIDNTSVDLLSWVDGTPLSRLPISEPICYQLGALLARTHTLADAWQTPADFSRPVWDLTSDQPSWGRFWDNPQLAPPQQQQLYRFQQTARAAVAALAQPDYGLIHADLVPDNVLYNNGALALIDFDDGGFGHRLFDLATITHRSRRHSDSDALAQATIDGYCSSRPLDHRALPLFEAMRACSYLGWNISRLHETGARTRNDRFISEAQRALERFYRQ